jgi:hypothetical protein
LFAVIESLKGRWANITQTTLTPQIRLEEGMKQGMKIAEKVDVSDEQKVKKALAPFRPGTGLRALFDVIDRNVNETSNVAETDPQVAAHWLDYVKNAINECEYSQEVIDQLVAAIDNVESKLKAGTPQNGKVLQAYLYDLRGMFNGFFGLLMLAKLQPGITAEQAMEHPEIINLLVTLARAGEFDAGKLKVPLNDDPEKETATLGSKAEALLQEYYAQIKRPGANAEEVKGNIAAMIARKYAQPSVIAGSDVDAETATLALRIILPVLRADLNVEQAAARAKDAMNAANSQALREVLVAG